MQKKLGQKLAALKRGFHRNETILYANRVTSVYIVITFRYRYINGISNDRLIVIEIRFGWAKEAR